jgi:hypothetical protein
MPAGLFHSGGHEMSRKERIVRYTDKELENMQMHGQDKSDWKSAAAMSGKEIEAAVAEDHDEAGVHIDWSGRSV